MYDKTTNHRFPLSTSEVILQIKSKETLQELNAKCLTESELSFGLRKSESSITKSPSPPISN